MQKLWLGALRPVCPMSGYVIHACMGHGVPPLFCRSTFHLSACNGSSGIHVLHESAMDMKGVATTRAC